MVDKVVDASALAALLFNEPEAEQIAARVKEAMLFTSPLLEIELANVCWKKNRKDPARAAERRAALVRLPTMGIAAVQTGIVATFDLATKTGLTAYDASYLLVAQLLGAELVTLDRELAAASSVYGR